MITGSNTNVRYRGKLFHVQTEDSGKRNPHVISHLFLGGTILASDKTDYSDQLDLESETLEKDVKALIDVQHKSMLERLKSGDFNAVIDQRLGADTATRNEERAAEGSDTASGAQAQQPPPTLPTTEPALDDDPPRPSGEAKPRAFGAGVGAQKPLDEVILDYLVEKARDRGGAGAARSRKRE